MSVKLSLAECVSRLVEIVKSRPAISPISLNEWLEISKIDNSIKAKCNEMGLQGPTSANDNEWWDEIKEWGFTRIPFVGTWGGKFICFKQVESWFVCMEIIRAATESARRQTRNTERDKFVYESMLNGLELKAIRRELHAKGWEAPETQQGVSQAAKRYAKANGKPWPIR